MTAPHLPPAVLEACLAYAHTHLFENSEGRLFWHIHAALAATLAREHTPGRTLLLAHLVGARDLVARELVRQGKVCSTEKEKG